MANQFSFAAFVAYGNNAFNNVNGNTPEMETACKTMLKKNIALLNYPTKDEIGIIDEAKNLDYSPVLEQIPNLVSGFMKDEDRAFEIPAANDNMANASIHIEHVDEKVNEGIIQFGEKKGQPYKSVTAEHDEVKVKNNVKKFKK